MEITRFHSQHEGALPRRFSQADLPALADCHRNARVLARAADPPQRLLLPVRDVRLLCGFPSPADDYASRTLDLNDLLVQQPDATFFAECEGESMRDAGIESGDLLVIDKSLEARDGDIVVAVIDGAPTVKWYRTSKRRVWLEAAHEDYPPIHLTLDQDFRVWGVVTSIVKLCRRPGHGPLRAPTVAPRQAAQGDGAGLPPSGDGQAGVLPERVPAQTP